MSLVHRGMLWKTGTLSLALLLASRLLGLVRESAQAAAFGVSGQADAAVLMLALPDWLAGLLVSGALTYVLLPHWARQTPVQLTATQRRVAVWLLAAGTVLAGGLLLFRFPLASLLAAGLPATLQPLVASSLVWSALAVPAALLSALWVTRLQHERDVIGMYAANVVFNTILILALVLLSRQTDASNAMTVLGGFLLGAMLTRLAWLHWRLPMAPVPCLEEAAALPTAGTWIRAALAAGLPLALPFVARSLASQAGVGALATYNYAWKLVELPLVLVVQLVAALAFPAVARAIAQQQDPGKAARSAFAMAWMLACATAAALLVGAPAIANVLFGWGRMNADDVARVATWGAAGAWGLLPQAIIAVGMTILATMNRMHVAVWAYGLGLGALAIAGGLGWHDGAELMWVLNSVLAGVALAVLVAMGRSRRDAKAWLPWRDMIVPSGLVVLAGVVAKLFPDSNELEGLMRAFLAATVVAAGGWFASPVLRLALRR